MAEALVTPYNFVPFTPFVFQPDWAERVSRDVPFSDGFSGSLFIEIEAVTPLFVGAGKAPEATESQPAEKRRFTIGDEPAIPGTSLKGAVRNVLEIASFGRIGPGMDDRHFSIRDLHNPEAYLSHMTERTDGGYRPKSRAGLLFLEKEGRWLLRVCEYSVVRQIELERYFRERFRRQVDLGRRQGALDKYRQIAGLSHEIPFTPDDWRPRDDWAKNRVVSRADAIGSGGTLGRLVLTGQPQDRGRRSAKAVEFLFHGQREVLAVPDSVRQAFEEVHRDPNTGEPTPEWDDWRKRLMKGNEVPVFWLKDEPSGIRALGLTMMFRLAYRRSTRDMAKQEGNGFDLANLVFGRVGPARGADTVRGRVRFLDVIRTTAGNAADEQPVAMPMLAPKPAFYPAYVRQEKVDHNAPGRVPLVPVEGWNLGAPGYTTYMVDGAVIRGWKRYPVATQKRHRPQPAKSTNRIMTAFTPLGRGTVFWGRVDFHNLRLAELGALAWSITFGAADARYCHSIGAARFAGYGVARLRIVGADVEPVDPDRPRRDHFWLWDEAVPAFERMMEQACRDGGVGGGWRQSAQLRELLAMADPEAGDKAMTDGRLAEMEGPRPFQDAKKREARLFLQLYTGSADPGSRQERSLSAPQKTAPPGSGTVRTALPSLPRRASTVDGEAVEVLKQQGSEVLVRFLPGRDTEWIPVTDLRQ